MTQTTGIDHDTEKAEALPHEYGCFEIYAERLVESGAARTGEYDEVLESGMTVMSRFHFEMLEHTAGCNCQAQFYTDEALAE